MNLSSLLGHKRRNSENRDDMNRDKDEDKGSQESRRREQGRLDKGQETSQMSVVRVLFLININNGIYCPWSHHCCYF